ncbi:MAG TPA: 4-hydroxyphenylacetate 3-hydroxylase N-terminal domain-containing protein [Stellaceae bacterium]|nr:4-hydroxyphenylacetate 3-hydroxylase N-terminal domain-containing protein [Stellaceae bacterium]
MLLSGRDKLLRMRDGRRIYVGAERIDDVTTHPDFRRGAETVAALYDAKEGHFFEEDSERFSLHWLRCRTREDLRRRSAALKAIADASYGLIGRSPDHVAGMVTGLTTRPQMFEALRKGSGEALLHYYEHARRNDLYLCFAVTPPSGIRDTELFPGQERDDPRLRVIEEDADGGVVSGMKMLATSAAYADEVWIGNLTAIDAKYKAESITAALPLNAPGVALWARQPYAAHARREADYPLSWRFDESDCVLVCDRVRIPWERVFLHNDGNWSRRIYIESGANSYANHQSNVRFWAKMGLIVGLASRLAQANGIDKIPAVREELGRLAALEATIAGLVAGQIEGGEAWPEGFMTPNRRMMYATLNWCQENHSAIIDALRTLLGALPLQMPASIDVLGDPDLRARFERWWKTPNLDAVKRMKLYKLAWDLTGSEFAGRHQLYEKFYAGNSIIVRNQSDREAPWDKFHAIADGLMERIEAEE